MTKTISKSALALNAAIEQRGIDNAQYLAAVTSAVRPADGRIAGTADHAHLTVAALALLAAATAVDPTAWLDDERPVAYTADDEGGTFGLVHAHYGNRKVGRIGSVYLGDGQLTLTLAGIYNARTGETIGKVTAIIGTAARA